MSVGKIGRGYFLIGDDKFPVFVTEISASIGQTVEFRGHFCGPDSPLERAISDRKSFIKNVIFNDPATVVIWGDGSKTVVKCQPGDTYSKETGLALCIAKKFLGNKGNFNKVFKTWIPEEKDLISVDDMRVALDGFCQSTAFCSECPLCTPVCRCGCGTYFDVKRDGVYDMTDDEIRDAYKVVFK